MDGGIIRGLWNSFNETQRPRNADERSDIYSLGCTLYDLLVGRPPYEGETHMAVIVAHREQPIPSILVHRSEVPPGIEEVFRRMVAKKPADRFSSMSEVIGALRASLMGGGPVAVGGSASAPQNAAPPPPRAHAKPSSHNSLGVTVADHPVEIRTETDTLGAIAAKHDTVVTRRTAKAKGIPKFLIAAVAGVLLLLMLGGGAAAVILSLRTPEGTLQVESDDPDVKVAVKQGGELVEIVDAKDGWKVGLKEGKYELEIAGGEDQFELNQNTVVVHQEVGDDHLVRPPWQSFTAPADGVLKQVDLQPLMDVGEESDLSIYVAEGLAGAKIYTQKCKNPADYVFRLYFEPDDEP